MNKEESNKATFIFFGMIVLGLIILFLWTRWQQSEKNRVYDSMIKDKQYFCSVEYTNENGRERCDQESRLIDKYNSSSSDRNESLQYNQ